MVKARADLIIRAGKMSISSEWPCSCMSFRSKYDPRTAAFVDLSPSDLQRIAPSLRDTCPACQRNQDPQIEELNPGIKDRKGNVYQHAFTAKGKKYHLDDFVLFRAPQNAEGPARIGKIEKWLQDRDQVWATVKVLGRVADIKGLPDDVPRDEVSPLLL